MHIVLFHGYGADGADLSPLAGELDPEKKYSWHFPNAPLRLPFGGYAWFPIDVEKINRAQETGVPVDFAGSDPGDIAAAREEAFRFLKTLKAPWSEIVVGGFSQGAMLAVDVALRAPESPRGLIALSGNLINEKAWRELAPRRKGLRFFQSHGLADPILGHRGAVRLNAVLNEGGLRGKLLSFEGGHAIPPEVLDGIGAYLKSAG